MRRKSRVSILPTSRGEGLLCDFSAENLRISPEIEVTFSVRCAKIHKGWLIIEMTNTYICREREGNGER